MSVPACSAAVGTTLIDCPPSCPPCTGMYPCPHTTTGSKIAGSRTPAMRTAPIRHNLRAHPRPQAL
eukprot:762559-Hanusia_phi.AAC.7